jgi:hypothetical protein
MNFRMPSLRATTAVLVMKIDRARCIGCEIRLNMMPRVRASRMTPFIDCITMIQEAAQHACGPVLP